MSLHETYCSVAFLEELYTYLKRPGGEFNSNSPEPEHLRELAKLIHRHSELILDTTEQEIFERSCNQSHPFFNPNLKALYKSGRQFFISIPDTFKQLKIDKDYFKGKTTELYFIDEPDKFCSNALNANGIHCLNFNQFPQLEDELFEISVIKTDKNIFAPLWETFKNNCPTSNSMIIVDPYLKYNKQGLALNLFHLLESLLPSTLAIPYHLAIIISDDLLQPLEPFYNEIKTFLGNVFNYEVELTMVQTKKSLIHDRNILTNSYWINSGHGFDLILEKNGKKYFSANTTIHFYPITCLSRDRGKLIKSESEGTLLTEWEALIKMYREIYKNTLPKIGKTLNIVGSGVHRLLK